MKIALDEFIKDKQVMEEGFRDRGEKLIKKTLKEFFNENKEVEKIKWRQYTPYFNDGDECVFHVDEVFVRLKKEPKESNHGDYEDGFLDSYDFKDTNKKLSNAIKDLYKLFENVEDIMKVVFGDHAEITATENKIVTKSYQHD